MTPSEPAPVLVCSAGNETTRSIIDGVQALFADRPIVVLRTWRSAEFTIASASAAAIGSTTVDYVGLDRSIEGEARDDAEAGAEYARSLGLAATAEAGARRRAGVADHPEAFRGARCRGDRDRHPRSRRVRVAPHRIDVARAAAALHATGGRGQSRAIAGQVGRDAQPSGQGAEELRDLVPLHRQHAAVEAVLGGRDRLVWGTRARVRARRGRGGTAVVEVRRRGVEEGRRANRRREGRDIHAPVVGVARRGLAGPAARVDGRLTGGGRRLGPAGGRSPARLRPDARRSAARSADRRPPSGDRPPAARAARRGSRRSAPAGARRGGRRRRPAAGWAR